MATEYDRLSDEPRRTSPFLRALIIAGIGFAGGLVAMGYLLTHWDVAAEFLKGQKSTPRPPVAMMKKSAAALSPSSPVDSDIISMRIGAIETRLDSIEDSANAASGNANRAEGLLVAFAARRALDR
ncbi:MAG TPA: hypothetical protein VLJ62_22260, partial [Burkholderiaceae bacterium]|nr:hypothetical protein [Burkholderiaceae bacterium]